MLTSVEITTEKLTVTKQAHFFELIIDKIKDAGGAILLTPADGFRVQKVIPIITALKPPTVLNPDDSLITEKESASSVGNIEVGGEVIEINKQPLILGYKVYWKATDGEKSISNMWQVND